MRWPKTIGLLFSTALVVRLVVLIATGRLFAPETFEYEAMAANLLAGRGLVYGFLGISYASFTGPVYPAVCAAVYAVTNSSHIAMVLVQAIFSALLPVVGACLGRELGGHRVGLMTGLLVTIHPGLLIYTTKLHPLVLETLGFTTVAWGALWLRRHPSWRHRVWVGLVLGLAILSRPTAVVLAGLMAFWLGAEGTMSRKLALRVTLGTLMIAMGVVLPWTLRNYRVHHRLVLVQSTSGISFWKGNNPNATGSNLNTQGDHWRSQMSPELQARLRQAKDELEQDAAFWQDAIGYVARDPAAFFERLGKKLAAFWWKSPTTGQLYPSWYLWGYQGWWIVTTVFGLAGLWRSLRERAGRAHRDVLLLLLFCAAFSVLQSLFYVEGRHRWAIDPLLLVVVGQGIAWCLEGLRKPGVDMARAFSS